MVVRAADHAAQARRAGDRFRDRDGARLRVGADGDEAAPCVDVAERDRVLAVDGARRRPRRDDAEAAAVGLRREQRAGVAAADADDVDRVDVGRRRGAEVDLGGEADADGLGERRPPAAAWCCSGRRGRGRRLRRARSAGRPGPAAAPPRAIQISRVGGRPSTRGARMSVRVCAGRVIVIVPSEATTGGNVRASQAPRSGPTEAANVRQARCPSGDSRLAPPAARHIASTASSSNADGTSSWFAIDIASGHDAHADAPAGRASAPVEPRLQAEREQDADLRGGHLRCLRAGCRRG